MGACRVRMTIRHDTNIGQPLSELYSGTCAHVADIVVFHASDQALSKNRQRSSQ